MQSYINTVCYILFACKELTIFFGSDTSHFYYFNRMCLWHLLMTFKSPIPTESCFSWWNVTLWESLLYPLPHFSCLSVSIYQAHLWLECFSLFQMSNPVAVMWNNTRGKTFSSQLETWNPFRFDSSFVPLFVETESKGCKRRLKTIFPL